jgi:hypothetical protein
MKSKLLTLASIFLISSSAFAGWRVHYIPEQRVGDYPSPERVTIIYSQDASGYETLTDTLTAIKAEGKIEQLHGFRPHPFTESPDFQKELKAAFEELAPKEWAAAEKSAGNIHNPKISPLRKHLFKAFMHTSLAKEMTRDLKPFGLIITDFGVEKLRYEQENGKRMVRGMFHISVSLKQDAEQAAP